MIQPTSAHQKATIFVEEWNGMECFLPAVTVIMVHLARIAIR